MKEGVEDGRGSDVKISADPRSSSRPTSSHSGSTLEHTVISVFPNIDRNTDFHTLQSIMQEIQRHYPPVHWLR